MLVDIDHEGGLVMAGRGRSDQTLGSETAEIGLAFAQGAKLRRLGAHRFLVGDQCSAANPSRELGWCCIHTLGVVRQSPKRPRGVKQNTSGQNKGKQKVTEQKRTSSPL